jgi:SpoVK/Ycf46/Vps4 family AAA+-type ATPase
VESIGKAFLRPGRIDAVINFTPPDAEAAERLIVSYGKDLIDPDAQLLPAAELLAGAPAAMMREVVERAKLQTIARNVPVTNGSITGEDLRVAATSLAEHFKLSTMPRSHAQLEHLSEVGELVGNGLGRGLVKSIGTFTGSRMALPDAPREAYPCE